MSSLYKTLRLASLHGPVTNLKEQDLRSSRSILGSVLYSLQIILIYYKLLYVGIDTNLPS